MSLEYWTVRSSRAITAENQFSNSQNRHCERSEAIHFAAQRKKRLVRGACHRAALRADPLAQ
jgi:hypothetical protein